MVALSVCGRAVQESLEGRPEDSIDGTAAEKQGLGGFAD